MRKAILKSTGKTYFVIHSQDCGSKEDNERRKANGEIFCREDAYDKTLHSCYLDKNGKRYGRHWHFFSEQLEFID